MVNERQNQFHPGNRYIGQSNGSTSRAPQRGQALRGEGRGALGLGKAKLPKRHKKIPRDTIRGVTKGDIRRLARRGGVKRISSTIYDDVRDALKSRLETVLRQCVAVMELSGRKTVAVTDVVFTLNRLGTPLYGFEPSFTGSR